MASVSRQQQWSLWIVALAGTAPFVALVATTSIGASLFRLSTGSEGAQANRTRAALGREGVERSANVAEVRIEHPMVLCDQTSGVVEHWRRAQ